MTKVFLDSDTIKKSVIPRLIGDNSVETNISSASYLCNSMSVPSDFEYRNTIRNYSTKLNEINGDVRKYCSWIENVEKKLNEKEKDFTDKIGKIDIVEIKKVG